MKLVKLCGAVVAALFGASAGAQTCASPDMSWHPDTTGDPPLLTSTCGHETGLISACEGGFTITGSVYVARVSLIPEATYTQVAVGGDGSFTPNLYVVRTSVAGACDFDNPGGGDTGACQTASSIAVLAINIPPGEYFFIVGKSDFDPEGACGNFTLTSNGNFPVSLQSFTVG